MLAILEKITHIFLKHELHSYLKEYCKLSLSFIGDEIRKSLRALKRSVKYFLKRFQT